MACLCEEAGELREFHVDRDGASLPECIGDLALIESGKRIRFRASIVARGGLRWNRALARQTEPRLSVVTAELGRSQLDDL